MQQDPSAHPTRPGLRPSPSEPARPVQGSHEVGWPFPDHLHHSQAADGDTIPKRPYQDVDFDVSPFTLAWEITRACALRCLHCRAEAQPRRDPRELTAEEGFRLIDQIAATGSPILVVTGGDPMMRRDVFDFISYAAKDKGLRVALAPSATKLVTSAALEKAREAGALRVQISLDGSGPEVHDSFRGFTGSFQRTTEIMADLAELGVGLQVGTTVSRRNLQDLPRIMELVARYEAVMWNLFFLVPTGRGALEDVISPQEHEEVFHWMYETARTAPFDIRTTAAQHYRRVVIQRRRAEAAQERADAPLFLTGAGYSFQDGLGQAVKGVNDGNGFAFIDHVGNVCPSGFLQLPAGNVRRQSFTEIYRHSPLFRDLRDYSRLKGKCGLCDFREVCGGSRARAFAVTGDYLESDPYCVYMPPAAGGSA